MRGGSCWRYWFCFLFRLPRPFPYFWGFGTFPWRSIEVWTCGARINLLLYQLPHQCLPPHPAPPRTRSALMLFQSVKSSAPPIRWPWSSPLGLSLELLLKVCVDVYVPDAYGCHQLCLSWILAWFTGATLVYSWMGGGREKGGLVFV